MDRLLVLRLEAQGCSAEALLNGIPLARVDAARPCSVLPVHEFTVSGENRLELRIWPPALLVGEAPAPLPPLESDGQRSASLQVLLPRMGHAIDPGQSRNLAQLLWAPEAGMALLPPIQLTEAVLLPVNFPRWRWLDAPPLRLDAALQARIHTWLCGLAEALTAGRFEPLLQALRSRALDLATAYGRDPREGLLDLHQQLVARHAQGGLVMAPIPPAELLLRPIADGRLLDCLLSGGDPALRTEPDAEGQVFRLPLRIAVLDGQPQVML